MTTVKKRFCPIHKHRMKSVVLDKDGLCRGIDLKGYNCMCAYRLQKALVRRLEKEQMQKSKRIKTCRPHGKRK